MVSLDEHSSVVAISARRLTPVGRRKEQEVITHVFRGPTSARSLDVALAAPRTWTGWLTSLWTVGTGGSGRAALGGLGARLLGPAGAAYKHRLRALGLWPQGRATKSELLRIGSDDGAGGHGRPDGIGARRPRRHGGPARRHGREFGCARAVGPQCRAHHVGLWER